MKNGANRKIVLEYAAETFGTESERPWPKYPENEVLRHPNGKWYGIIMNVPKSKLGKNTLDRVDILVCKCDPTFKDALLGKDGFLPAYHMNKEHWITVLLDASVEKNLVFYVCESAYQLIENSNAKKPRR